MSQCGNNVVNVCSGGGAWQEMCRCSMVGFRMVGNGGEGNKGRRAGRRAQGRIEMGRQNWRAITTCKELGMGVGYKALGRPGPRWELPKECVVSPWAQWGMARCVWKAGVHSELCPAMGNCNRGRGVWEQPKCPWGVMLIQGSTNPVCLQVCGKNHVRTCVSKCNAVQTCARVVLLRTQVLQVG